jgi:Protein of unknown function (DUF3489)
MSKAIQNSKPPARKLTDPQMKMLHSASVRVDRCLTPISSMRGAQVVKAAEKLITAGLVREVKAKASIPVWRRDGETGTAFALKLTAAGAKAVVGAGDPPPKKVAAAPTEKGERPALAATASSPPIVNSTRETAVPSVIEQRERGELRPNSKIAAVIGLLSRSGGATLADLIAETGWLPHTTRAALTGLRKRGYVVTLDQPDRNRGSSYSITSKSADSGGAAKERAVAAD